MDDRLGLTHWLFVAVHSVAAVLTMIPVSTANERHAGIQRCRPENHVFADPFADIMLSEITRADIFDARSRLLRRCAPATAIVSSSTS
jgi:hypothetical protein